MNKQELPVCFFACLFFARKVTYYHICGHEGWTQGAIIIGYCIPIIYIVHVCQKHYFAIRKCELAKRGE